MKQMKSLKKFEAEGFALKSSEMNNISGGLNRYTWEVTTYQAGDRREICQVYRFNGTSYVPYGPPYATGNTCIYDPATGCN